MHIHFIAIGGSAMHNLALALHHKGYTVTGSDDEIVDPARSRLQTAGLLPPAIGWCADKITPQLDAVILGMHARADNPELLRAKALGVPIYSYPEYLYEQTKDKTRIVVGGSHGKTSTTAMIMHVLRHLGIAFDYMVGAQLEGFDTMVGLSHDARIAVFEGDEYLTSPIDPRPKFHLYRPHVGIITGIAWDHINVFPTWEMYVEQFAKFTNLIEDGGSLIYCQDDPTTASVAMIAKSSIRTLGYSAHPSHNQHGQCLLDTPQGAVPLHIFGRHNMQNLSAALLACQQVGVSPEQFYQAIQSFEGAARRLQLLATGSGATVYYDFAHSPSKLQATTEAVRAQYTGHKLYACMELHTFSSLSKAFLEQYQGTMQQADVAMVYYSPHTISHKQLTPISEADVQQAFGPGVQVFTSQDALQQALLALPQEPHRVYLLMSSGNFGGMDLKQLANTLTQA